MKISITFKDPDGVSDSLMKAGEDSLSGLDLTEAEKGAVLEVRYERISSAIEPWVRYGEYVTIVIDTEEGTATVQRA